MTTTKTAKATTLLVGVAAITAAIGSITKRGAKLDADIQHCALSILAHVDQHNNVTLINDLYKGMPKGSRKAALSEWLLAFGKCKANEGADKKTVPFLYDGSKKTDMVHAAEKPWFDFKPDADPDQVFDFAKMLTSLLNKASKANPDTLVGGDLLAKVRQALEEEAKAS